MKKVMAALEAYDWLGEYKRLENVIERVYKPTDSEIELIKVSTFTGSYYLVRQTLCRYIAGSTLKEQLYDVEKKYNSDA